MIGEATLAGASLGIGVWLVIRGWAPPPRPVASVLADLQRPRWVQAEPVDDGDGVAQRLASRIATGIGVSSATTSRLALVDRTPERHALDKLIYATVGAALPVAVFAILAVGGANPSTAMPLIGAGVLAIAGFLYPGLALRGEADRARTDLTTQLALYLDLVVVLLAGGRGVDGALNTAAKQGEGIAFQRIRRTLTAAQLNRESPWRALDRLAVELGLPALAELAASVTLAGESGARVRESLTAKAHSIRVRLLAEAEADAHRRSETMSAPVVLMLTGFVVLIAFPAMFSLMTF